MDERIAARLLLLDPDGRILLMQVDDPSVVDPVAAVQGPRVYWATLGGQLEPGEDIRGAARREAHEETGRNVTLGRTVWCGEKVLHMQGTPTLFKETFVVAFLDCPDVTRDGWSANERAVIRAMRWWTLDELRQTSDTVYPVALVDLLPAIIAGDYPDPVRRISL